MKIFIGLACLVILNIALSHSAAIEPIRSDGFSLEEFKGDDIDPKSISDEVVQMMSHSRQRREPKKKHRNVQASIDVEAQRRQGTNVNAQVGGTVWQSDNGRSKLDANANYNRRFGGPGGSSKPNYGAGVNFSHRF